MKEGWTIKPLGQVAEIYDYLRKPITKADRKSGIYPYYGATGLQDYVEGFIFDGRYLLVGEDGAKWGAGDKSAYLIEGKCWVNNHAHILQMTNEVKDTLVEYYLNFKDLSQYITGAVVPKMTQQALRSIPIPVPSIAEQENIVAELDLLSSVIEKKKEQLKELDNLAQSIFYDMFGDPITNEKGWDICRLENVCGTMTKGPFGSDIKKSLFVPRSSNTYKVYIQANAIEKNITLGDYYISNEYFKQKLSRFEVHPFDYIITCDGTLGRYIRLPETIEKGVISASLLKLSITEDISYKYFEKLWDFYILHQLTKEVRNTALVHLPAASKIGKVEIPLPPIDIQQNFTSKIEAIEQQKSLIKKSIEETEALFNSRMDYYFN